MYLQVLIFILALFGLIVFKESGTVYQRCLSRKRYVVFLMILLILQSGLRNLAVGSDTLAYYYMFESVINEPWDNILNISFIQSEQDFGYTIICKCFSMILRSYRLFLMAIAIFFFSALGRIIYKYLDNNIDILVSIALYQCLYYGFFSITGLRQTIATGILLFAIPTAFNKNIPIKFLLSVFIASTIHRSAFLFTPFCLLPYVKNNKMLFFCSLVLFIPMFSAGNLLSDFLQVTGFEEYAHYMQQSDTGGAVFFTCYIALLFVMSFYKLKRINSLSSYNYVFASAIAIAFLLSPLLALDPNNQRIVQYYSIFGLVVLPQLCKAYSSYINNKTLSYLVFSCLVVYVILRNSAYAFFWQDMVFAGNGMLLNDKIILK